MREGRYAGVPVLVTGAQGFVGSWLVRRLLDLGAEVVVPARQADESSLFRREGLDERCKSVQVELADVRSLVRVLNELGIEMVFHLAARTISGEAAREPLEAFEVNVRGTFNLLEACRSLRTATAIVVASSYHAYARDSGLALREDAPLGTSGPYEVSKGCTDLISRCYADTFELPVAVTRLANVYGGGDLNFSRLVPDAARALVSGKRPVIRSSGVQERDFLYVEDAVDAYIAVADSLERHELAGRAWNAGSGTPLSVRELVSRFAAAGGRDLEPEVQGEPDGEVDRQYLDSGAIRDELGWAPRVGLDEGLQRTYAWYESALA